PICVARGEIGQVGLAEPDGVLASADVLECKPTIGDRSGDGVAIDKGNWIESALRWEHDSGVNVAGDVEQHLVSVRRVADENGYGSANGRDCATDVGQGLAELRLDEDLAETGFERAQSQDVAGNKIGGGGAPSVIPIHVGFKGKIPCFGGQG